MKIKVDVEIEPFEVPSAVIGKREFGNETHRFSLKQLKFLELNQMCNDFRKSIFEKAGIKDTRG